MYVSNCCHRNWRAVQPCCGPDAAVQWEHNVCWMHPTFLLYLLDACNKLWWYGSHLIPLLLCYPTFPPTFLLYLLPPFLPPSFTPFVTPSPPFSPTFVNLVISLHYWMLLGCSSKSETITLTSSPKRYDLLTTNTSSIFQCTSFALLFIKPKFC